MGGEREAKNIGTHAKNIGTPRHAPEYARASTHQTSYKPHTDRQTDRSTDRQIDKHTPKILSASSSMPAVRKTSPRLMSIGAVSGEASPVSFCNAVE